MRRADREVTAFSRKLEIVRSCDCCRLGLLDGSEVYIVPMNFGFEVTDGRLVLYFHSAGEGRKLRLLAQQAAVSFEMDTKHELVRGETGCAFSYRYQCAMGTGHIEILREPEEKMAGMQKIMEHYTGNGDWTFPAHVLEKTTVLKLTADTLSCKEH